MTTFRVDHSYDGTDFSGWASQPGERTVEDELTLALGRLFPDSPRLTVAGRTDAGVHAWGQVASFESTGTGPDDLRHAINGMTPPDLAVTSIAPAVDGFDARRDATSRTYCYRVDVSAVPDPFERRFALHWPWDFDPGLLGEAANAVLGKHDFTAFTPSQNVHVRFDREVTRCGWIPSSQRLEGREAGTIWEMWIEADSFMRSMVRVLVGTMLEVGCGRRGMDDFVRLLEGAPRDRAGETAPAHGLHLAAVEYAGKARNS